MPSPLRIHLALIAVSVLFGAHYVLTKHMLQQVPARSWVLLRIAAATALLVPLSLWLRRRRGWPDLRTWLLLGVAALLGVTLNQVLFTLGIARTVPEHAALVTACVPTWTLVVAALAGHERVRGRRVAAIASALVGVLYLLGVDRVLWGDGARLDTDVLVGDLLIAANGFAFAIHLVMMRRIARDVDPWTTVAILFLQGTLMIGVWSAPALTAEHARTAFVPPMLYYALYLVLASTVLTYVINTWALRHTHSSQVALYINLQPIVAATLNWAMGAPAPDHRFYVALALVAFGLWLQTSARRR